MVLVDEGVWSGDCYLRDKGEKGMEEFMQRGGRVLVV